MRAYDQQVFDKTMARVQALAGKRRVRAVSDGLSGRIRVETGLVVPPGREETPRPNSRRSGMPKTPLSGTFRSLCQDAVPENDKLFPASVKERSDLLERAFGKVDLRGTFFLPVRKFPGLPRRESCDPRSHDTCQRPSVRWKRPHRPCLPPASVRGGREHNCAGSDGSG